jgi:tetratricopeptide (TPR) repeat protein
MDSLDYIDDYFGREPSPEEARQFEKRIQEDPAFASDVAYYLSARITLKEVNAEERKEGFRELYQQTAAPAKIRRMHTRRWRPVLAAASLIAVIVLCWTLFIRRESGPELADQYIRQNLDQMSVRMGAADSIQTGLILYNDRKYPEALQQFDNILRTDTSNFTALLNAGIVALRLENYDKAISYFRRLEVHTDPHINPALFYEALTLIKRNYPGDPAHAKQFLERIVQQDLNKKEDAQQLLRKM